MQTCTQHSAFVKKARQASCNLRKKNQCIQQHIQFTHLLCEATWPCSVLSFEGLANQHHLRWGEQTWQVSLIQTQMMNPNVKSCCNVSGIQQAHMRPALCFLFSYDVSPASLAQLHYRCSVCHADGIHFPHSVKYCILWHSAQNPVR